MRVVTYNIRNVRALDRASFWWRRRGRLAAVLASLDADLIGMQEAYPSQLRWLAREALPGTEWGVCGEARNGRGRGEAVPLWHRLDSLRLDAEQTRWFGPAPHTPGSRFPGAQFPRIATMAEYTTAEHGTRFVVVNLHLDSASPSNRTRSIEQVVEWIDANASGLPTVVLGDFNARLDEAGLAALIDHGLRSALSDDAGPTATGFGRWLGSRQQIDHVFVSADIRVDRAEILTAAGCASDHYPVVVDLSLGQQRSPHG